MSNTHKQLDPQIIAEIQKVVRETIKVTVNGKVDTMNDKLDAHMKEIKPFLDGWEGGKTFFNAIKWVAGFVIAVASAIIVIKQLL